MARNHRTRTVPDVTALAGGPALGRMGRMGRGLRVGLLGGSFNPAHGGHLNLSLAALKRLELDRVWCW